MGEHKLYLGEVGCKGPYDSITGIDYKVKATMMPRLLVVEPPPTYYDEKNKFHVKKIQSLDGLVLEQNIFKPFLSSIAIGFLGFENVLNDPGSNFTNEDLKTLVNNLSNNLVKSGIALFIDSIFEYSKIDYYYNLARLMKINFNTLVDELTDQDKVRKAYFMSHGSIKRTIQDNFVGLITKTEFADPDLINALKRRQDLENTYWLAFQRN